MNIDQYVELLTASGMPHREVARAALFAEVYGLEALSGEGCTTFAEPECEEGWDCISPSHQKLVKS